MGNRQKRLGELLKHEISDLMLREIKDPRIGFVSITSVDVAADLRTAKVYVSVLGNQNDKKASLAGLRSAARFIRHELGTRLRLKHVPEIIIIYDKSIEEGARISALIDSVIQKEHDSENEE
jgi:ribosome-binding factor A